MKIGSWVFVTVLVGGCVLAPPGMSAMSPAATGSSASSPRADGQIAMPDLFGLPRHHAIAALRRAGYQGNVTDDQSLCGSVVDGRVIEPGQVCYQFPPAGRVQGARLPILIRVQRESPWRGNAESRVPNAADPPPAATGPQPAQPALRDLF